MSLVFRQLRQMRPDWFLIATCFMAIPQLVILLPGQTFLSVSGDAQLHLDRTIALSVELQNGYLWPRWSHYLHGGYGYPVFNYYSPGIYWLASVMHMLTGVQHDIIISWFVVIILFLRPLGAYLFALAVTTGPGALVAAAVYTLAPFSFRELMVQVNIPQFAATAIMPLVLWAFTHATSSRRVGWYAAGAIFFACLILTHHLTAFLFAPVLVGFLFYRAVSWGGPTWKQRLSNLARSGVAVGLGLGVSAVYWMPALMELNLTQIDTIQDTTFSVQSNYIDWYFLLSPTTTIDRGWLNWHSQFGGLGPRAGYGHLLMVGLGLLVVFSSVERRLKVLVVLSSMLAIFSLFIITPASDALWRAFPLLSYVQFPWRFLMIFVLALILPAALAITLPPKRWRGVWAVGLLLLVFLSVLPLFYAPVTFIASGNVSPLSVLIRERNTGNIGTTASNEYLPRWSSVPPLRVLDQDERDALQTGRWRLWIERNSVPANTDIIYQDSSPAGSSVYRIITDQSFDLVFRQLYFPGWDVRVNNEPVVAFPATNSGLLAVSLTPEDYELSVRYRGTTMQRNAANISLISLLVIVAGGGWTVVVRRAEPVLRVEATPNQRGSSFVAWGTMAAITIFVLLDVVVIRPHTTVFRPRIPATAPPAQHLLDVGFGDSVALVGYDVRQSSFSAGDSLHIRLYWRLLSPTDGMLRSAVRLTGRNGRNDYGGSNSFHIGAVPISRWNTEQYVTDDHFFVIDTDAPPFILEVRVSVFDEQGTYLTTADSQHNILLRTIRVDGNWLRIEPSLLVERTIRFEDKVTLLGYVFRQEQAEDTSTHCITLRWQADANGLAEYAVMIHLLNAEQEIIHIADGPPLANLYPTNDWQAGQQFDDTHCFSAGSDIHTALIGLYDMATLSRLVPVSADMDTFPDNAIPLPLQ